MAKIFITGSSDGLGLLTAKELVTMEHQVVLHARNDDRAKSAKKQVPGAEDIVTGDLSNMDETKRLAEKANKLGPFNVIIHNAGIYHIPNNARSEDGLPLIFAVNSLAPYILTAMINRPERLIYLSSGLHIHGYAGIDRLNAVFEGSNFPTYSDTKLHDLILALTVARKWPNVVSNAVDPGWVPTKMGGSGAPGSLTEGYGTQVWLAVSQDKEAIMSGRYLHHRREMNSHPHAHIKEIQEKFVFVCEKLSGVTLRFNEIDNTTPIL